MPVERPDVVPAQLFEHGPRCHHTLHVLFGSLCEIPGTSDVFQYFFGAFAQGSIGFARPYFGKVGSQAAGVVSDRHLVVVQNHQHVWSLVAGMCQCLERHASGDRAIANDRDDLTIDSLTLGG